MVGQQDILLVEDNEDDAILTLMAFKTAGITNPVVWAHDGMEALDYLFGRGSYVGRDALQLPAVIFLDLNLPKLDGIEVLKAIRGNAKTRTVPVVILTSSVEDEDRLAAYEHYANSYVQKPAYLEHFVNAAQQLGFYWKVLNLPPS